MRDVLAGKIALVTRASRGIGASVARIIASRGADIAINYHSKASRAEIVAAEVRNNRGDILEVWLGGARFLRETKVVKEMEARYQKRR